MSRRRILPIAAALTVALAGCSLANGDLRENRARWQEVGVDSYRYVLRVGCFCPPEITDPVVVEVRDGVVASVTSQATGLAVEWPESFVAYDTVEELFDVVGNALDRGADELSVAYHDEYGVPVSIEIDYSERVADDEMGLYVDDFTLTEPST